MDQALELESQALGEAADQFPALLIHGTGASIWGELPKRLAARRRVIVYDRRGFGASPGAPGASLSDHATDAAALIEAHDAGPAILVGWSSGAIIALEVAATRPDLVAGLVLLEPPLHASRRPGGRQAFAFLRAQLLRRTRGWEPAAAAFLDWALRSRDGTSGLARLSAADREACLANAEAIVRELDQGTGEHLSAEALASIAVPCEVLEGGLSDSAFHRAAKHVEKVVPAAERRTVDHATHALQVDAPEAVTDSVERVAAEAGRKRLS